MKFQIIDTDFGNVIGRYPTLSKAVDALSREIVAGGSVDDLAVIHWSGGQLKVDLRGSELSSLPRLSLEWVPPSFEWVPQLTFDFPTPGLTVDWAFPRMTVDFEALPAVTYFSHVKAVASAIATLEAASNVEVEGPTPGVLVSSAA